MAALFLTTLWLQTGSPLRSGYSRYNAYMVQNGFRFTSFGPQDLTSVIGFDFADVPQALARTASGMFRLNFDLFGWPSSFTFLILALPVYSRRAAVVWSMALSFLLLTAFQRDWGVDSFGPVHAFELALPLLVLTIVGARDLRAALAGVGRGTMAALPESLLLSLMVCAWVGFVPVRLRAIRQITAAVNEPLLAPQRAGLHNAIVFAPLPFAPPCGSPSHFVLFRPVNDPDLRNDILWVNHIDLDGDRRLAATMPGRSGYVMQRNDDCQVTLTPIATAKTADVPRGRIRP
jgi:hypothetical protein